MLAWLIATPLLLLAGPAKIEGKAPAYLNRKIIAYSIQDYISMKPTKLAESKVDDQGKFLLVLPTNTIQEIILKIDGVRAIMYIQPDANYQLTFPAFTNKEVKSLWNNEVEVEFDTLETYDINNLVLDFESRIDDFMAYYFVIIGSQAYQDEIDTLKQYLSKVYQPVQNTWFKKYIYYTVASMEQIGGLQVDMTKLKMKLFTSYILQQDIEYTNPKFMAFFNQFYTDVFKLANDQDERRLSDAINYKKSLKKLNDVLSRDEFLKDERIRELVIIKALGEEYFSYNYYQDNIIVILDSIRIFSKFQEHQKIAANLIDHLTRLGVGYPAPDFRLFSIKQEEIKLSQFKGKYIYLHFWATWNSDGLSEMKIMTELNKKYGKDILFISVNMDENPENWRKFLKIHPEMNWVQLYYGEQPQLFEEYRLQTLSQYFLIGADGNFIQSPAYKPTPNGTNISIEKSLFEIRRILNPNGKY